MARPIGVEEAAIESPAQPPDGGSQEALADTPPLPPPPTSASPDAGLDARSGDDTTMNERSNDSA